MRLDVFLKLTRLIKRRSLAKKYCDHNLVKVNRQPAKAAKEIRIGDVVIITFWNRIVTAEVLEIPPKGLKAKESSTYYKIISEHQKAAPQ